MSKGIAVHILITIVFMLFYFWITDGIEVDAPMKLMTVVILVIIHAFTAMILTSEFDDSKNLYKQKL